MNAPLRAEDLWPLVQKLDHDEQLGLAKLALRAASRDPSTDGQAYLTTPTGPDEFGSDDDPLSWEAEGWESLDASG